MKIGLMAGVIMTLISFTTAQMLLYSATLFLSFMVSLSDSKVAKLLKDFFQNPIQIDDEPDMILHPVD